jgi:phage tail sheath protein FI
VTVYTAHWSLFRQIRTCAPKLIFWAIAEEAAYYVNVGLGKTMTTQDVLEGTMKVEIGIAAVRPAEFIILRFSHKLPEA